MTHRAGSFSKAALPRIWLSLRYIALGALLATSCQSPTFHIEGGEGGMGGEAPVDEHCGNGRRDFDETDEDCGGNDCGSTCGTGAKCTDGLDCQSLNCAEGSCRAPACDDRILNGDETGTDCGGPCTKCPIGEACIVANDCETPPETSPAVVECRERVCVLDCPDDTGDCNARAADGCEVDLLTNNNHCGGCALDCDPPNASGECVGGECLIKTDDPNQGCDTNYANCNSMPGDGCEVNLTSDPDHCGACDDSACSNSGGVASCSGGECSIACNDGYGDCDENARDNGCEVNTSNSVSNCGNCAEACRVSDPDFTAYCADGACGETLCDENAGDCDGDGYCSDSLLSVANCGGCGEACTAAHGRPDCVTTATGADCVIDVCDLDEDEIWADCDGSYTTGCEVNTLSNRFRCGGCLADEGGSGADCSLKEGTENVTATTCTAGDCQVLGCVGGYADCDGVFSNGCDTNLDTDAEYCGSCSNDCTGKIGEDEVTAVSCQSGSCRVETCSDNRIDCDGSFENGCEVNPNTSETHCGGCNDEAGTNCNAKIGDDAVTGVQCDSDACVVATCEPNRADCDGSFGNGCETNTDTSEAHCGGCAGSGGASCEERPHSTGVCTAGSCSYTCEAAWDDANGDRDVATGSDGCESLALNVLNYGTWESSDTGGSGSALTFSHTLQGAEDTARLILVGVLCRGNSAADCTLTTATYGTTQLTRLEGVFLVDSSAQIFYALDAALPDAGTHTVTLDRNDLWGSLAADVIEFSGAEQETFFADHGGNSNDAACSSSTQDTEVSFADLPAGSKIYAVGGGNGDAGNATTVDLLLATSGFGDYIVLGSGYSGTVSGAATAAFDFTGCLRSVMYAVGVRPERDY